MKTDIALMTAALVTFTVLAGLTGFLAGVCIFASYVMGYACAELRGEE